MPLPEFGVLFKVGDSLTLDDGRTLARSTRAISGVLYLTAEAIETTDRQLKTWLNDVSERPNGFASIDLRGLSPEQRLTFHQAARIAFERLASDGDEPDPTRVTYHAMADLIAMLDSMSRGEPPEAPPTDYVLRGPALPEDLFQIWKD